VSVASVGGKAGVRSRRSAPRPRRPVLSLAPAPTHPAPRAPFLLLVFGLLAGALVGLLLLNTTRAQDAFTLARLQNVNAVLLDQEQALHEVVQSDQDPARLAAQAKALGMVSGGPPAFVDAAGKVVGAVPPGAPAPGPTSVVQGGVLIAVPMPSPSPAPTPATNPVSTPNSAPNPAARSARAPVAAASPKSPSPPAATRTTPARTPSPTRTAHPTGRAPVIR